MSNTNITDAIAIIGIACRFPGATDKDMFWKNLQSGKDVLTTFTKEELLQNGVLPETIENPDYVPCGYPIDDIEMFDASLFGYSPAEAKRIDPQQRLFLQCAWTALEDAGYAPDSKLHTGVFASAKMSTYQNALSDPNTIGTSAAFASVLGNDKDYIATRTSFKLGLTGPSFTVQTACSSSLAATHLAVESLLSGECDMALAGGVSISIPQRVGYTYEEGMICAPDAKCRAFDKDAAGICASNGVGAVLLKPLEDAVEDGDTIYAVIRGSAMNNDGANKAGFTAPSVSGQYSVIRDALSVAEESADNIGYVETHGTGTLLGDPIEIQALTKAYREDTDASGYCAIGSVKSNVGHLDTAAGICSLIKTTLALHHKEIPATLHYSTPNPHIPFASTPFFPIANATTWKKRNEKRLAGVSSFGVGGTNVHMILQAAEDVTSSKKHRCPLDSSSESTVRLPYLIPLSAHDIDQLDELRTTTIDYMKKHEELPPSSVMKTLFKGRKHFPHRIAVAGSSITDVTNALENTESTSSTRPPKIGMIFTGQGCQYSEMGKALFTTSKVFQSALLRIENALENHLPHPLTEILFNKKHAGLLDHTSITQPGIFAIQYALTEYWKSLGIEPKVVTGHSIGEFAAACVAGIMTPENAATLIAHRGALTDSLPQGGGMMAVLAPQDTVITMVQERHELSLDIAAFNGTDHIVLSGKTENLKQVKADFEEQGFFCKLLNVSHAFHSRHLDPILQDFGNIANSLSFATPTLEYISSYTGQKENTFTTTSDYWMKHLRNPVQFVDAMQTLMKEQCDVVLEIGPHPILIGMAKKFIKTTPKPFAWIPSMQREDTSLLPTYNAIATLYKSGASLNVDAFIDTSAQSVPLPTYPFKREPHWEPRAVFSVAENAPMQPTGTPPFFITKQPHPTTTYTAQIGLDQFPALKNHVINGELVAPLGILTDVMAQVWKKQNENTQKVTITNLSLHAPVLLDAEQSQTIHLLPQDNGEITLLQKREDEWVHCVSAQIEKQLPEQLNVKERTGSTFTKKELPEVLQQVGVDSDGHELWTLKNAQATENTVQANIILSDRLLAGIAKGTEDAIHPSIIDPCIQLLGGITHLFTAKNGAPCILLPTGVKSTTVYGSHEAQVCCEITLTNSTDQTATCDIKLVTPEKQSVAELIGLSFLKLPVENKENISHRFTSLRWKKYEELHNNDVLPTIALNSVISEYTVLTELPKPLLPPQLKEGNILTSEAIPSSSAEKVLFYAGNVPEEKLVQVMNSLASHNKLKELVVITQRAIDHNQHSSPIPEQRVAWELARVLKAERPECLVTLIDVDTLNQLSELPRESKKGFFVLRNKEWLVAELVDEEPTNESVLIPIEGTTTLVTGGTGGLGHNLIARLIDEGHKTILVTGRSAPKDSIRTAYSEFEKSGVTIVFQKADCSSTSEMKSVLALCNSSLPPLGSVFHLAGQTSNKPLAELTWEEYRTATKAKMTGAALLDEYTRTHPVAQFVLFSSISTLHGIAQAGAYTASNGYLEALAAKRCYDGLAATCISWGPFKDCGMLSQNEENHTAREALGINAWTANALSMLKKTSSNKAVLIAADIVWSTFNQAMEAAGTPLAFTIEQPVQTLPVSNTASSNKTSSLSLQNLEQSISEAVTRLLQTPTSPDHDENLLMAGLDSLLFLQFSQQIKKELDVRITPAEVFANPTITNICACIRTKAQPETSTTQVAHSPFTKEETKPFPLTDTQYAYWAGRSETMPMGNISCHSYAEYDVTSLDNEIYVQAWDALIERHPMLRMTINEKGQQQILSTVPSLDIQHHDLSGLIEEEQQGAMEGIRGTLSHKVHDTTSWPLFTVETIQLSKSVTRICMSIDLLLADARSLQIMMRELRDIYTQRLISGIPSAMKNLPELQYSFKQYIADTKKFLTSSEGATLLSNAESYWENRLESLPHGPELPTLVAPESIATPKFTHRSCVIKKNVWEDIKKQAKAHGLTPSLVLLSCYAEVIARWSHNKAFCLNVTLFNRQPFHEQVSDVVGDFTTLSLLEITNDPTLPFASRAGAVRDRFWADMEHTSVSGVEVIRKLTRSGKLPFGESYPVVFTSNISGGNSSGQLLEALGTRGFNISQTPQVWLDNQVHENNGDLIIHWDSVDELFPENMIEDMLSAYKLILMQLSNTASWDIKIFDCLPQRTLQALEDMNKTEAPCPEHNLWSLFTAKYNATPDATAIICSSEEISYGELGARAAGFASRLSELGVRPNTLVGISLPKGIDQIAAVLGTQAVGAVFVPIAHEQPASRKQIIAEESNLAFIIAEESFSENVTHVAPNTTTDSPENYSGPVSNSDLAYIIFTSGSTGKPKGVSITHEAAVNTLIDINNRYAVSHNDVVFGVSRLTFDLAIYDIFGAFAAGATLVLPDDSRQNDPEHWVDCLASYKCTIWNSAPALMQLAIQYAQAAKRTFSHLRLAMLSGDKIVPDMPQALQQIAPNAVPNSLGGATEASIWSICHPIKNYSPEDGPIPYGRPMMNQEWYVLDSGLGACPEHVVGDLYIGGKGLAQGYYGRDDLTQNAFLTHPETGKRIYRTGDMGAFMPEGYLTIIGRRDFQVKIRGHRVEPSEIEHVLSAHPEVNQMIVTPITTNSGTALVSYYSGTAQKHDLASYAAEQLPRYMVPAYYVAMKEFPMTPSGKVDRKQLPQPAIDARPEKQAEVSTELTPLQATITEVWNDLLQLDHTPLDMDFFNAGGDSVLAAQLVLGIRNALDVSLALPRLFENPTIELLSKYLIEKHPSLATKCSKNETIPSVESEPLQEKEASSIVDIVHVDVLKKHPVCAFRPDISGLPTVQGTFKKPFITGATGFLGIHVLKSLLENGAESVTCLVRAKGKQSGIQRILDTAQVYGFSLTPWITNIQAVNGDLSQKYYGLSESDFTALSEQVDAVFHAGALVHYIYSCESLLGPNVIGTREAIRLASTGIVKPLHHVSTVSVFSPLRCTDDLTILEDERIEQDMNVFGGYPQSKWLAERLIQNAIEAGLPAYIYRPGLITGTSSNGTWNKEDFLWRIIQGSLQAGVIPDLQRIENFLPVDTVAEALVHIARGELAEHVYHLDGFNPVSSHQLIEKLQQCTAKLKVVSYAGWREAIARPENPLYPLLPLFPEEVNPESISRQLRFDNSNAKKALQNSTICFPSLNDLLPVYLKSMVG